jgi:hypothetical protein
MQGNAGLLVPGFAAGGHAVGIDHRRNGDGARRDVGALLDEAGWRRVEVGVAGRTTRCGDGCPARVDWGSTCTQRCVNRDRKEECRGGQGKVCSC